MTQVQAGFRFRYRAAAPDGRIVAGSLVAPTADAARAELRSKGLLPTTLSARNVELATAIPDADLALGLRLIADLLDSGLSPSRAMDSFASVAPPRWAPHVDHLREAIKRGSGFGNALAALRGAVPQLATAMVHAGEMGPGLSRGLGNAADFYESKAAARTALTNALIYPGFLALAALLMIVVLGGFVIPRFAAMLADLQQELPPLTAAILAIAGVSQRFYWVLLCVPVFLVGVAVAQRRNALRLEPLHKALLRLPIVGPIRRSWASSNACATLATLLESGVSLPAALAQAAEASGDHAIGARMRQANEDVLRGTPLSAALRDHDVLTPLCIQLCQAAEQVGNQAPMLARAAAMERTRAHNAVQRALKLVEPVFILGLGGVVALVAAGLLQAIYAMRPAP